MLRIAPASWKFSLSCVTFFTFLVSAQLGNSSVGCPASNYSTTLTSSGLIFFISCDTDREGGDLTSQPAASLNECLTLCEADPQCKSASWVQGVGTEISICYEKSAFFPNFWSPGVDMVTCLNCEFALPAQTVTAILTTTLTITDFTTLDLSTVTETAVSIHTITLAITLDASTIRETAVSTVISSAPPGTITATEVQISTLISTLLSIQPGAIVTSFIPGPTVTSVSTSISTVTITIIQVSTVIPSQAPAIATSFVPGPNLTFVSSSIVPRPTVTATAVQISTAAPSEAPATTSISMCYLYGLSNISTSCQYPKTTTTSFSNTSYTLFNASSVPVSSEVGSISIGGSILTIGSSNEPSAFSPTTTFSENIRDSLDQFFRFFGGETIYHFIGSSLPKPHRLREQQLCRTSKLTHTFEHTSFQHVS